MLRRLAPIYISAILATLHLPLIILVEVTGNTVSRGLFPEYWQLLPARGSGVGAAWVIMAATGWVERAGHLARWETFLSSIARMRG